MNDQELKATVARIEASGPCPCLVCTLRGVLRLEEKTS